MSAQRVLGPAYQVADEVGRIWTVQLMENGGHLPSSTRLDLIEATLLNIDTDNLSPNTISGIYQAMGELAWMLEGCEAEISLNRSSGRNIKLLKVYHTYTSKLNDMVATVKSAKFIEMAEAYLGQRLGTQSRADTRKLVWFFEGNFPQHRLGRVLALYLNGSQLGSRGDQHAVEGCLVDPSFLRADLIVKTPAWMLELLREHKLTTATGVELDDEELDYLRGLWAGQMNRAAFEVAVRRARLLARGARARQHA
jgi:hypothetical protein